MGNVSNEQFEISGICGKIELWYAGRILLVYCERNPRKWLKKMIKKDILKLSAYKIIHSIHTCHSDNLHLPQTGLTLVQKGVAYSECKIYNHFPSHIKNILNNIPLFKSMLRKLLLQYVLYSVDEYYQQNFNDCVY
jgi:hypothetical protein